MRLRSKRDEHYANIAQIDQRHSKSHMNTGNTSASVRNWSFQENSLYVQFLQENKRSFDDQSTRRSSKIFLEMSLFLRSKTPEQCRTHHQKVIAKYGSLEKIRTYFLETLSTRQQSKPFPTTSEKEIKKMQEYEIVWSNKGCLKINLALWMLDSW